MRWLLIAAEEGTSWPDAAIVIAFIVVMGWVCTRPFK